MEPIVIVGGGRAGCSLACGLALAGIGSTLVVRRPQRREAIHHWLATLGLPRKVRVVDDLDRIGTPGTLLLAVPDREIAALAARLAHLPARTVRLHLSGALPAAVLRVDQSETAVGTLHPLCALPDPVVAHLDADQTVWPLRGALMALDGDPRALDIAGQLAEALGGLAMAVPPEARSTYHAAAALVANDLVALIAAAGDACQRAGLAEAPVRRGLLHLAATSLHALERLDPSTPLAFGLTGAVARGDAETLAGHLAALDPETRQIHTLLSRRLLALVEASGQLPADRLSALRAVLGA